FLIGKYGGGITRFETSFERQSAGYEVNDIGYLQAADHQAWNNWAALNFLTPTRLYNSLRINGNFWSQWTTNGLPVDRTFAANAHMILHNNWGLHGGFSLGPIGATYCDRCARGGPAVRNSAYVSPWISIAGDDRRRIAPSLAARALSTDNGHSSTISVEPSIVVRATSQLLFSLDVSGAHNVNDTQWIGNFRDSVTPATHYAFARLNQTTLSTSLRATYIATPALSIQFYAQPFVSDGTYSAPRELSATPRATDYASRYQPYGAPARSIAGFSDREFKSNTVVRWEYRPGSTLYLVWTQGRELYDNRPDTRGWVQTYPDLLRIRPDNTFLVKMSYWLNR
ncbi:MAG: DUF5916 domain-containing protein, partial [Gemmatimonadaceae bacterium]